MSRDPSEIIYADLLLKNCLGLDKRKKLIFLFSNDAFNLLIVTVKTFIMLQKISISNKCCINTSELCQGFHKNIKQQKKNKKNNTVTFTIIMSKSAYFVPGSIFQI